MINLDETKISVVVPCFNEEHTVALVLKTVLGQDVVGEVIIIDDGSTDKSVEEILKVQDPRIKLIRNDTNQGKGKSIWSGINSASHEYLIIQDADLEYSPEDYKILVETILKFSADAVYGSRFLALGPRRAVYYWHSVGNSLLTHLSNSFTNIYLTDMETCYKLLRTDVAKSLNLQENRFGIEPEITAKLAKLNCSIYEVPIQYNARTYAEGKKIGWKDAVSALRCILKYSLYSEKRVGLRIEK
jgi:glycosyltransferase involved in cell wall biosynthesis